MSPARAGRETLAGWLAGTGSLGEDALAGSWPLRTGSGSALLALAASPTPTVRCSLLEITSWRLDTVLQPSSLWTPTKVRTPTYTPVNADSDDDEQSEKEANKISQMARSTPISRNVGRLSRSQVAAKRGLFKGEPDGRDGLDADWTWMWIVRRWRRRWHGYRRRRPAMGWTGWRRGASRERERGLERRSCVGRAVMLCTARVRRSLRAAS
jgi:hypothetical protein